MQLNHLNVDCLLAIFSYFPLNEQLHLRQVCRQWKTLLEAAFRRKQTLAVVASGQSLLTEWAAEEQLKKNALIVHNLALVRRLFTAVRHLTVCFEYQHHYLDLPNYLAQSITQLESLTLRGHCKPNASFCRALCESIGRLECLTRLDLMAANLFTAEDYTILPVRLPPQLIGQLECFTFSDYVGDLSQMATHFRRLKWLRLEHEHIVQQLPDLVDATVAGKISHLHLSASSSIQLEQYIRDNFVNLKYFCIVQQGGLTAGR